MQFFLYVYIIIYNHLQYYYYKYYNSGSSYFFSTMDLKYLFFGTIKCVQAYISFIKYNAFYIILKLYLEIKTFAAI